jgi:hypothetical protein
MAQYVKFQVTAYYGDGRSFGSAAMLNLFEDITQSPSVDAEIRYDIDTPTNQNVTARLVVPETEKITVTNNDGSTEHTFTENGAFTFEFTDSRGRSEEITATVNWIDKEAPTAEVTYSPDSATNTDVVATIIFSEEVTFVDTDDFEIYTDENGHNYYTFTENGSKDIEFTDEAGNTGSVTLCVDWIVKEIPIPEISYSTETLTNKDVTVTVSFNKAVTLAEDTKFVQDEGEYTYTFEQNGSVELNYSDGAGNSGSQTISVDWIDKEAPTADVQYGDIVDGKVTAELVNLSEEITVLNNGGSKSYTFEEDGIFEFIIRDAAGNISIIPASVNNLGKGGALPKATIVYSTTEPTHEDVTAYVTFNKKVTVTGLDSNNSHTFTENGRVEFSFEDEEGNTGNGVLEVTWIDKEAPTAKLTYSTTSETTGKVTAILTEISDDAVIVNNDGKAEYTFDKNGTFNFILRDKAGNETRIKAEVTWIKVKSAESSTGSSSQNTGTSGNNSGASTDNSSPVVLNNIEDTEETEETTAFDSSDSSLTADGSTEERSTEYNSTNGAVDSSSDNAVEGTAPEDNAELTATEGTATKSPAKKAAAAAGVVSVITAGGCCYPGTANWLKALLKRKRRR